MLAIAYRMLGSMSEAEDVVQEAFLRFHRSAPGDVASPRAYLTTVTTRLAIDALRSARAPREQYVGEWLPEPLLGDPGGDVAEQSQLAESLRMAFLVVLETLSPIERAVFLLHEVFGHAHAEIAGMVGKSEANCRQIAARARRHVEVRRPRFASSDRRREELVRRFLAAAQDGIWRGWSSCWPRTRPCAATAAGDRQRRAGRRLPRRPGRARQRGRARRHRPPVRSQAGCDGGPNQAPPAGRGDAGLRARRAHDAPRPRRRLACSSRLVASASGCGAQRAWGSSRWLVSRTTATFLDVDDAERLRGLEAATELARRAAGFAGPFGIQLSDDTRLMAHRALEQFDRFIQERLQIAPCRFRRKRSGTC